MYCAHTVRNCTSIVLGVNINGRGDLLVGLRSTTAVRTCRALALSVEERAERKRAVRL